MSVILNISSPFSTTEPLKRKCKPDPKQRKRLREQRELSSITDYSTTAVVAVKVDHQPSKKNCRGNPKQRRRIKKARAAQEEAKEIKKAKEAKEAKEVEEAQETREVEEPVEEPVEESVEESEEEEEESEEAQEAKKAEEVTSEPQYFIAVSFLEMLIHIFLYGILLSKFNA